MMLFLIPDGVFLQEKGKKKLRKQTKTAPVFNFKGSIGIKRALQVPNKTKNKLCTRSIRMLLKITQDVFSFIV